MLSQPSARFRYPLRLALHDLTPSAALSYPEVHVLTLGAFYVPPYPTAQLNTHLTRCVNDFIRRVQWCVAYNRDPILPSLMPALWTPSTNARPPVYTQSVVDRMRTRLFAAIERRQQLESSRGQHPTAQVANAIRARDDLLIAHADKNMGPVKIAPDHYDALCRQFVAEMHQLSAAYPPSEVVDATHRAITQWLANVEQYYSAAAERFLPSDWIRSQLTKCTMLPRLYLLIKIHKDPVAGRPIVAAHSAPLSPLSTWLSHVILPVAQRLPTYVRDSSHLVSLLSGIQVPTDWRIYTADVRSMYPNMDCDRSIRALDVAFELIIGDSLPLWYRFVAPAVRLLYAYNFFVYDGRVYQQSTGVAMGSNASAAISDVFLCPQEQKWIYSEEDLIYLRYRDDIFCVCPPRVRATTLANFSAEVGEFMELVWTEGSRTSNFLDVSVTIAPAGRFTFETFRKDLNAYAYIPVFSHHPHHVITGWLHGELKRLHRTNSTADTFRKHIRILFAAARRRGYGTTLLTQAVDRWTVEQGAYPSFPGPSTSLALLNFVADHGMPRQRGPPLVAVLPAVSFSEDVLKPIIFEEMKLIRLSYRNVELPVIAYTIGPTLGSNLSKV